LKMKLVLVVVAVVTFGLATFAPEYSLPFVAVLTSAFFLYGLLASAKGGLDFLNDAPNALRVFFASLSGALFALRGNFVEISASIVLFAAAILLNDEYQRRTLDSIIKKRNGGSVALLGIDGSGKSTHSAELEDWFRARGYYCTRLPFHRYFFVDRLASLRRADRSGLGAGGGGNPFRPLLSAIDNLTLWVTSSLGRGLEGRVVLYDRFIWSTYVKYAALGYSVEPIRWLYMLPRPKFAVILDVPVEKSLAVIESRSDHIKYRASILARERGEYLTIAKRSGFPVIDATRDYATVQSEIESFLSGPFPARQGVYVK
jgi:dTMP kinase